MVNEMVFYDREIIKNQANNYVLRIMKSLYARDRCILHIDHEIAYVSMRIVVLPVF